MTNSQRINGDVGAPAVKCFSCNSYIRLDTEGFIRTHKKNGLYQCDGSGRHAKFTAASIEEC